MVSRRRRHLLPPFERENLGPHASLDGSEPTRAKLASSWLQIVPDLREKINIGISNEGVFSYASGPRYSNLWYIPFDPSEPPRALTSGTMVVARPSVSPGGDRVAFEAATDGPYDVWVLDLATGDMRPVTRTSSNAVSPAWSPSGDSIAFVSIDQNETRVWVKPVDGITSRSVNVGPVSTVQWRVLDWAGGADLLVQNPGLQFNRFDRSGPSRPLATVPQEFVENPRAVVVPDYMLQARSAPQGGAVVAIWSRPGGSGLWLIPEEAEPRLVLEGSFYPIGWSPDASRVYGYDRVTRIVRAVDLGTGEIQVVRELPFSVREIDLDVTRDGLGVVAAVADAPGDAVIIDLGGAR